MELTLLLTTFLCTFSPFLSLLSPRSLLSWPKQEASYDVNFEANRDLYDDLLELPDMATDDDATSPSQSTKGTSSSSRIKEIITLSMSSSVKAVFDIDNEEVDYFFPFKEEVALGGGQGHEEEQDQADPVDGSSAVILGTPR